MKPFPQLPVYHKLKEISSALESCRSVLVAAEPGAGKTMLVPMMVNELTATTLTILVEPRRIAARAAAYGIAEMHGLSVGKETGFTVRGEKCRCRADGILAVTPGILLQMLQHDPLLENVGAIIFDEFHIRSIECDLALTLVTDMRSALRDDLLLVIMSATIDTERIADFIYAPTVKVQGRNFPVKVTYRDTPGDLRELPRQISRAILENLAALDGDMLVFLPGAEDIRQCRTILENALGDSVAIHQLHASLPLAEQRAALAPASAGIRKIILATNVAESSLTIDNIRCVIDSGWEKRAVWHPECQMTFLETRRITKASAIQRSGRAGRTADGVAVRCYHHLVFEQFTDFPVPEILTAELSSLLLAVRCWGSDIDALRWLDRPPVSAVSAAENVLKKLALLDENLRPTTAGKRASLLPLAPRLAAMMILAPPSLRQAAAEFAAILEEKDDFARFDTVDLRDRVTLMRSKPNSYRIQKTVLTRLLYEFPPASEKPEDDPGILIALAFPEWIARRRSDSGTAYQLANGSAAVLKENDPLRQDEFLAIARLEGGNSANARIRLALPVAAGSLEKFFADRIGEKNQTVFDPTSEKLLSFAIRALDQLPLHKRAIPVPRETVIPALLNEAARRGIPLPPNENKRAAALVHRIRFARSCGMTELPDLENIYDFLIANAMFFPDNVRNLNDLRKVDYSEIFHSALTFAAFSELDRLCPEYFTAPSGHKFPIDYTGEQPSCGIIIQELYAVSTHPTVGRNRIPLRIELLSPARRPVQVTSDLPGFWAGSWKLVRAEMKSRYPKHNWELPENKQ